MCHICSTAESRPRLGKTTPGALIRIDTLCVYTPLAGPTDVLPDLRSGLARYCHTPIKSHNRGPGACVARMAHIRQSRPDSGLGFAPMSVLVHREDADTGLIQAGGSLALPADSYLS